MTMHRNLSYIAGYTINFTFSTIYKLMFWPHSHLMLSDVDNRRPIFFSLENSLLKVFLYLVKNIIMW